MNDLITFLRARLDEEERIIEKIEVFTPLYWVTEDAAEGFVITVDELMDMKQEDVDARRLPAAAKTKHPGPWRTLPDAAFMRREIEAKRRILDEHAIEQTYAIGPEMTRVKIDVCVTCRNKHGIPCATVRLLALPYADMDGYREEWKP